MDRPAQVAAHVVPGIEDLVVIGRGGAGIVYKGRQPELDREVAVKVVLPEGGADGADVAAWRREVRAMARLSNHPNILPVYDGGITDDGLPYLVMPYVPSGSLGAQLRTHGPLPPAEVVALGTKLAGALAAAHAAGVLHRDVKPDNVLRSPYGEPLLSDFGIARLVDATATATRNIHATVAYAAPEVLSGQPATEASDVYGLGATLHACLRGEAPFASRDGEALVALAVRVTSDPPPDLVPLGVPAPIAAVLARALAKDPSQRIPTAVELRRELEEAAAGGIAVTAERVPDAPAVVVAPAPPPPAPAPAPARRTPSSWRWLALVLVAVIAAVAGALVALRDDRQEPGGGGAAATTTPSTAAAEPSDTTEAPPPATDAGDDVASAASAYLDALVAGDFERAYAMTTSGFQAAQPYAGYVEFWSGFEQIVIEDGPTADEEGRSATVLLVLDGAREQYTLTFAESDDGGVLVDGPRPR